MDFIAALSRTPGAIYTVGMHTCGEPTRIVVRGFPPFSDQSSLLAMRAEAKSRHDHLRRRIMLEPRGHREMYGAILISATELEEADIGVLFCHNEGFSTMCGHATIALGRFLVDTWNDTALPRRRSLDFDPTTLVTNVTLHAPCGLVHITVPIRPVSGTQPVMSDPLRPVSFLSVPSFVAKQEVIVPISRENQWQKLRDAGRDAVTVDIVYGGAFYAVVSARDLGFEAGITDVYTLEEFNTATAAIKRSFQSTDSLNQLIQHPSGQIDFEFLYGVIVVDNEATRSNGDGGSTDELGLCFFADQQVDRSPTGSGVCGRIALAIAKGSLMLNEARHYHSIVGSDNKQGTFEGTAVEKVTLRGQGLRSQCSWEAVVVKVSGYANYTGSSCFITEPGDDLSGNGFGIALPTHNRIHKK